MSGYRGIAGQLAPKLPGKDKLEKRSMELLHKDIDQGTFNQLVANQYALSKMKVLTQKGLAQIKVDSFIMGVRSIIIKTILEKFLPGAGL